MTHGETSIAMRRRLWVKGYCVSPSWNVHVDCVGATCTGYFSICGAPPYTVLKSHAVLKTHAVQSPTDVGPIWICADRACARMRTFHNTPTGRTYFVQVEYTRTLVHLPEYIHAFPRPVSISHVQPYTDSAAGRPDPDTRQRAVGYDTADRRMPVYHAVYTVQV